MGLPLRSQLEAIAGAPLALISRPEPEFIPTGIGALEFPRGSLSEISGPASSGRTSVAVALLAEVTSRGEVCALIDTAGAFDPAAAAYAGVSLDRLLWIRCHDRGSGLRAAAAHGRTTDGAAERALKAADLVIQAGGFGLVIFDLGDTPLRAARRISLTSWFRLRRAVEHTATAIVVIAQEPLAKTCASLVLEMRRARPHWHGKLLKEMDVCARRIKPAGEMEYVRLHTRLG